MSYAGPPRARGSRRTAGAAGEPAQPRRGSRPASPTFSVSAGDGETDWERVALFGVGVALGIAVGAGAALLTTPMTGSETRAALRSRARRLRRSTTRHGRDAWQELRDELENARLALRRRKLRRTHERTVNRER